MLSTILQFELFFFYRLKYFNRLCWHLCIRPKYLTQMFLFYRGVKFLSNILHYKFLNFETDQFLILAMWDFIILH
jgi:hypothetical protein